MMGPAPRQLDSLHTLAIHGFPLGVRCVRCRDRAPILLERLRAHSGNMKEVRSPKLKCAACGSREWTPTNLNRPEEVAAI